jgi:septal ring-binding cell division protein DamX
MSRRTVLVAVWVAGTALATSLAFGAVSLVLAGVSDQSAEQLRFGNTVILQPASLQRPGSPTTTSRRRRAATTTTAPKVPGSPTSIGGPAPTGPPSTDTAAGAPPVSAEPGGGGIPSGGESGSGSGGSGGGGTDGSGESGGGHGPSPATLPSSSAPVSTTYSTAGGTVTASCTGSTIRLVSASPSSGFTMQVSDSGPGQVQVKFGSADQEFEVQLECVGGRPQPRDN